MKFSFNLVDEPWIPCLSLASAAPRDLGLREVLVEAHEQREIIAPSPLVTLSLHRLLLTVLHRVFGPKDAAGWWELWDAHRFAAGPIDAYLKRWRPRLDLFDDKRPFYQVPSLDFGYCVPASKLSHELSAGNNALLFDHSLDDHPASLTASAAARQLVAHQSAALGGLLSFEKGQNPKLYKSAKSAPLVNCAVFLVHGGTLHETLLLNLCRYDPLEGEPFYGSESDRPAWERDAETQAIERYPAGYLDLLTWQSRRIRLRPEASDDGRVCVRQAAIMKGASFPDDYDLHNKEPMVAFEKRMSAKAEEPWPPLGFREERALWRDSIAVLQTSSERHDRPRILNWLNDLDLAPSSRLILHALGLCSDRANPKFWRHERLPLPLRYLKDDKLLFDELRAAIGLAEDVGSLLGVSGPLARCAEQLGMGGDRERVRAFVRSLGAERHYWAQIEMPFRDLLERLPDDVSEDADGETSYGVTLRPAWAATLTDAASDAFRAGTDGLQMSARALKAVALAEREFQGRLSAIRKKYARKREEVIA